MRSRALTAAFWFSPRRRGWSAVNWLGGGLYGVLPAQAGVVRGA